MLEFVGDLPPDVLAIEAIGKVTHDDYRNILISKGEAMMAKGPIRMLYVIGKEFTGFEPEALWDDSVFGFKHWHDFIRIAVVTDTHGCAPRSVCSSRSFMQKSGRSAYQRLQLRKTGSQMQILQPRD